MPYRFKDLPVTLPAAQRCREFESRMGCLQPARGNRKWDIPAFENSCIYPFRPGTVRLYPFEYFFPCGNQKSVPVSVWKGCWLPDSRKCPPALPRCLEAYDPAGLYERLLYPGKLAFGRILIDFCIYATPENIFAGSWPHIPWQTLHKKERRCKQPHLIIISLTQALWHIVVIYGNYKRFNHGIWWHYHWQKKGVFRPVF